MNFAQMRSLSFTYRQSIKHQPEKTRSKSLRLPPRRSLVKSLRRGRLSISSQCTHRSSTDYDDVLKVLRFSPILGGYGLSMSTHRDSLFSVVYCGSSIASSSNVSLPSENSGNLVLFDKQASHDFRP